MTSARLPTDQLGGSLAACRLGERAIEQLARTVGIAGREASGAQVVEQQRAREHAAGAGAGRDMIDDLERRAIVFRCRRLGDAARVHLAGIRLDERDVVERVDRGLP